MNGLFARPEGSIFADPCVLQPPNRQQSGRERQHRDVLLLKLSARLLNMLQAREDDVQG